MRSHAIALALAAALLPGMVAVWSLSQALPRFWDPCFRWGDSKAPASAECRGHAGTSETKRQAVLRLAVVNGGILLAGALGVLGAAVRRPAIVVAGAGLMLFESAPLIFSVAFVTVFSSGLLLLAAREFGGGNGGGRVIGSLAALAALAYVPALLSGAVLLIVLVAALVFVAAAGWWPKRGRSMCCDGELR